MRSLTLSLVLLVGIATHAVAQRPGITRPIQQARAAAAQADARTATAEAAGQETKVRRDSVPVTKAPPVSISQPVSKPAPTTASKSGSSKSATPAPVEKLADSMRTSGTTPTSPTTPGAKAPASTPGSTTASTASEKSGAALPPPQAAPGKGTSAGANARAVGTSAATKAAATDLPKPDSSATTISVGSNASTVPELRIDREVFSYDAAGRRDPFVSLFSTADLRPLFSDLLLVVINYDPQGRNSVAIMRDASTKEQYRVRPGQLIGRMRVSAIEPKRVLFTIDEFGFSRQESLVIGDTTKVRKQ